MITVFFITSASIFIDDEGHPRGYDDVFKVIERAMEHYAAVGLGEDYVDRLLRQARRIGRRTADPAGQVNVRLGYPADE